MKKAPGQSPVITGAKTAATLKSAAPMVLGAAALDQMLPMHLWVDFKGRILGAGPTLRKICPEIDRDAGKGTLRFDQLFMIRRPQATRSLRKLAEQSGRRLSLSLRQPPHTAFTGQSVPVEGGAGLLVNLSFGINLTVAVSEHDLTAGDFAPTDLTVEMLYLSEAKSAVMAELLSLTRRLQGAKSVAEEQAMTDTLTGLRNRRAMERVMEDLHARTTPFALMQLDLDFFKAVNDSRGHAAGDHVLQEVARVLLSETRQGDTVARIGGDEFVIVFPGLTDPARLAALGQRILAKLERPIVYDGAPCTISASIGTALSHGPKRLSPSEALLNTDRAIYASKHAGRGCITAHD